MVIGWPVPPSSQSSLVYSCPILTEATDSSLAKYSDLQLMLKLLVPTVQRISHSLEYEGHCQTWSDDTVTVYPSRWLSWPLVSIIGNELWSKWDVTEAQDATRKLGQGSRSEQLKQTWSHMNLSLALMDWTQTSGTQPLRSLLSLIQPPWSTIFSPRSTSLLPKAGS